MVKPTLAAVVVFLLIGVSAAQLRVDVRLVNVVATVTDSNGRYVEGLKASDFSLEEDGVPQQISHFSQSNDLPVSVRGGGHDASGKSLLDNTFGIDVGLMNGVHVDPVRRRAIVQGGAKWRIVDRETQAHGLGVTGGTVSDTGVAGLTLGGGIGWIMRRDGVTVDSLVAVTGVTADGRIVRASADEEPELYPVIPLNSVDVHAVEARAERHPVMAH